MDLNGFQIDDLIYHGNSTNLYRGSRNHDQQPVIIKQLNKSYPSKDELDRFRREYEIMSGFNSSGIVKAYSLVKTQSSLAMIIEDVNGQSIDKLLPGLEFDLGVFLKLAIQIAKIIARIHQEKIVHKNINPGNIIWNPETAQVKVTDFGAASRLLPETPNTTDSKIVEGELAYISPEQTGRMNRNLDFYTDFYSLGITLYEIATKRLPFESDNPIELVHSHIARTPVNPCKLNNQLPEMVSKIILKLMAKIPEDRYQSTFGLKSDLTECLNQFKKKGKIQYFKIGEKDISHRFQIPQKLYGRENEIEAIFNISDQVSRGSKETILITGNPGVGKSTIANEIRKAPTKNQTYLIYGKFNQLNQNIPFAAMIQAFKELIQQITDDGIKDVSFWKSQLLQSVGNNGQVIIDVIPELELIIGKQPNVPDLPPADAQNRFNLTFLNFIRTFSKNEQLLIIIIDDLQWADESTLKLIELIIHDADTNYLLFIGTYRDDEVDHAHPLTKTITSLQNSKMPLTTVSLKDLKKNIINQLLSETLSCHPEKTSPLAALCFKKTHGNPFFLKQFLQSLHADKKIHFNANKGTWQWDVENIRQAEITDNVIELMVAIIHKLPEATQRILQVAACIGTQFDLLTLSKVLYQSLEEDWRRIKIRYN